MEGRGISAKRGQRAEHTANVQTSFHCCMWWWCDPVHQLIFVRWFWWCHWSWSSDLEIKRASLCVSVCSVIYPRCLEVFCYFAPCLSSRFKRDEEILCVFQDHTPELPIYLVYLYFWTQERCWFQLLLSKLGCALNMHCLSRHTCAWHANFHEKKLACGDQKGPELSSISSPTWSISCALPVCTQVYFWFRHS